MNSVRIGVIGMGNIGTMYARLLRDGLVKRATLTAACDRNHHRLTPFADVQSFTSLTDLIRSGAVDAVVIATPHFSHPSLTVAGLKAGLHVLVEKPLAVHKVDCQRMIAAHKRHCRLVFAEMFNQRTDPFHLKIRELVRDGELGAIHRMNWTVTNWFRPAAYYASAGWRATWAGEGGGVLLNQAPHILDLIQWICGMPVRVRGFCHLGRYHNIEVEDDVTAYFEFKNGATGVFSTSTGEAPGTNRLEIAGENGQLVYENDRLTFLKNAVPTGKFSRTTKEPFAAPPHKTITFPIKGHGPQHIGILQNFADAILGRASLLAPAREGIHSVELANAILYSSLKQQTVELPLNARAYARTLQTLINQARRKK